MEPTLSPSFGQAWERFQALDSLRLAQETLEWEWTRSRTDYAAFLVLVADPVTRAHIAGITEEIRDIPGVDPYPEPYWHITLKGLGFQVAAPDATDELSPHQIAGVAAAARGALATVPAFTVQNGLVNGFESVVFLEVLDGGRTAELNRRLTALPGVPEYPYDGPLFLPHISIARFTSSEGLPLLKERLRELRRRPPGPAWKVTEVQLVRAQLAEEATTFEVLESYRLRGAAT